MPAAQVPGALLGAGSPSSRTEALLVNSSDQLHGPWHSEHDLALPGSSMHCKNDSIVDSGALQASNGPIGLEDLQPDVLHGVVLFLRDQDVAQLKQTSSRLRCSVLQACQHWAPKVEGWLMADHNSISLLGRLRDLDPQQGQPRREQQQDAQQHLDTPAAAAGSAQAGDSAPLGLPGGLISCQPNNLSSGSCSSSKGQIIDQQQQAEAAAAAPAPAQGSLTLRDVDVTTAGAKLKRLDWRQVWSCIQRAQQGPWQLDVQALAPAVSPHGVLLTFELLLQQPAPAAEPGCSEQQHTLGWKDSVTVMSFVLDRKTVDIVVDASGRVTSPQRDWCQGCIQLQPGQPRLLALEVSYIFPVPAWFLHPCTLAAPRPSSSSGSSCGTSSCASSVSGMALDQTWDSYSSSTAGSSASSMSISQSAMLCSAAPFGRGDNSSLASSSLSSSGSLGACTAMISSSVASTCSGSSNGPCGRPRLSLDLSIGFGSYVIDPRYIDEGSPNLVHRGLERIELSARACWRPSKVQSWLGRLLPGIRGHSNGSSNSCGAGSAGSGSSSGNVGITLPSSGSSSSPGASSLAAATAAAGCSPVSGHKPGSKPSFSVTLSKAAAWQVPQDTDRRFAEGFMFWAAQHKLEQLLEQYGVLPHVKQQQSVVEASTACAATCAFR
uniref:F-box domain-containing protein n=1 Tax=Tetradesmus obliquus TaxID=3088 RepID=A0A383VKV1_TETOB|eukprot:jgi/Sobl393_1/1447/SZX66178.1